MSTTSDAVIPQNWIADAQKCIEDQLLFNEAVEELKKLLVAIQHMKNPLIGAQEVMMQVMQIQGCEIQTLADVSNVESDIRSGVTSVEGDLNTMSGDATNGQDAKLNVDSQKFADDTDKLEEFLNYLKGMGSNSPISPSDLDSMITEIEGIKSQFNSDWGNGNDMAGDFSDWVVSEAGIGYNSPQIANIQSGLQILNQHASAFSTTTNTQLQYKGQSFQQIEGITNDLMQTYMKLVTGMVNNQRTS